MSLYVRTRVGTEEDATHNTSSAVRAVVDALEAGHGAYGRRMSNGGWLNGPADWLDLAWVERSAGNLGGPKAAARSRSPLRG